ncbi:hypothetical protein ACH42_05310 [Endozoicomonas sp. (ex Bugula neritina AB1)]|nr:hypothetical protein ACH42_05310 [Endozoicomonas sp. (ex Bugula neritina AB1)]
MKGNNISGNTPLPPGSSSSKSNSQPSGDSSSNTVRGGRSVTLTEDASTTIPQQESESEANSSVQDRNITTNKERTSYINPEKPHGQLLDTTADDFEEITHGEYNSLAVKDFYSSLGKVKNACDDLQNKLSISDQKLDKATQESIIETAINTLNEFDKTLILISPEILATAIHEKLKSDIKQMSPNQRNSNTVLNEANKINKDLLESFQNILRSIPKNHNVHKNLHTLMSSLKLNTITIMLFMLEGNHILKEPHEHWKMSNESITPAPKKLNQKGLSTMFDKDVRRGSDFKINTDSGDVTFSSEKIRDIENEDSHLDACTKKLKELCCGEREKLLPIASELVSQTPYNFLFDSISVLINEQLDPEYATSPSKERNYVTSPSIKRRMETHFTPEGESAIKVDLFMTTPGFSIMALTDNDQPFSITQEIMIKSSIVLDGSNTNSHKLNPITLIISNPTKVKAGFEQ